MKTLETIIEEYQTQLNKDNIDQEIYEIWKHSIVTQRLLNECGAAIIETILDDSSMPMNVDETALRSAYTRGLRAAFELVIDWVPGELVSDQ